MGKVKAMFRRKQHRKKRFTGMGRPKDSSVDGSCHSFEDQELHKMERLLGMKKKSSLSSEFTKDGLDYIVNFLSNSDDDSHEDMVTEEAYVEATEQQATSSSKKQKKITKKRTVEFNLPEPSKAGYDIKVESDIRAESGVTCDSTVSTSYAVPQKRVQSSKSNLEPIKRKIRGLVNRLSESNLNGIVTQLQQLYSENSRNDVSSVLTEVLLKATLQPILISSKMAMEHMMVIALLHSTVGTEIGAYFTEEVVKKFVQLHSGDCHGKESGCCLLLLAQLYTFKVVHCILVYDVIRKLLESFFEIDIELLVLLLKECGMEIRKDDPSSLKDIIKQIQSKSSLQSTETQSSRFKFMLEVIAAIRTNNSHKIPNYNPELKLHMKKLLRGLEKSPRTVMVESNQLKIPLQDFLEADTRGRWWVVGSSWIGRESESSTSTAKETGDSSELLELAKEQRMNTDVRKNIFCLIMTSEDYIDAFTKLTSLKLKSTQDREIVHVLMDCCLQEKDFNLFYVYLGQKLCEYHRNHQVTFQYAIWDKLKSLDDLNRPQLTNLCWFLVHMICNRALSVSVLRIVEFSELNKIGVAFYKALVQNILLKMDLDKTRAIFSRANHSKVFLSNLVIFIQQYLSTAQFQEQCQAIEECLKQP